MPKVTESHVSLHFEKQFDRLPADLQKVAARKLIMFENNPFHPGLETHKLKGSLAEFWSFSVNKKFRVLFRFFANNAVIYYDIDTHDIYK